MLSRTADNLYWLARYVERAEYLARILETTLRLIALPLSYGGATNEWESAVASAGCALSTGGLSVGGTGGGATTGSGSTGGASSSGVVVTRRATPRSRK